MKRAVTAKTSSATKTDGASPSRMIDGRIKELGDWRGEMLGRIRSLIKQADPDVVEEWKWRGVPVWEHDGIICTGETYKAVVKLTFAKGAALDDPAGLFNSSLDGNVRRAIEHSRRRKDQREGVESADPRGGGAEWVQEEAGEEAIGLDHVKSMQIPGDGQSKRLVLRDDRSAVSSG
ncbi:hypothetical protein ACVJ5M_002311 [Bradyrhizobium sp. S3.7.6]